MIEQLASLLYKTFSTDQQYHLVQQADGNYKKVHGHADPQRLRKSIENKGAIAVYQKYLDSSVKWICFDFDILKRNLNGDKEDSAQKEVRRAVKYFCDFLLRIEISYLLEFSGNRGFHVWITFSDKIEYRLGNEILRRIFVESELKYDDDLIAIDFFPQNMIPSDGVGKGVKIPLSMHAKSHAYSYLLNPLDRVLSGEKHKQLNDEIIIQNIDILNSHKDVSVAELEKSLGEPLGLFHSEEYYHPRIKNIVVEKNGFKLNEVFDLWSNFAPLRVMAEKITDKKRLSHSDRKLMVGIFCNVKARNVGNIHEEILLDIFKKTENFDLEITKKSIKKLSSFNFPSQDQIEVCTKVKFEKVMTTDELLKACIPKFVRKEDATFDLTKADVEVIKNAELIYLFQNDEASSRLTICDLSDSDSAKLIEKTNELLRCPDRAESYTHTRYEDDKTRNLVSLKAPERIATSFILKQFVYLFNFDPSVNSYGYKVNKGFSGGYIFEQWLYLWIKFISNISLAIEEQDYQEFYIVKTDIKKFYNCIPHDNLKRLLLGGVNERVDRGLHGLADDSRKDYVHLINSLFCITEKVIGSKVGVPQGPAYARYLAELYLDNLDHVFERLIESDEVVLYQRYVDDVFFICKSEKIATQKTRYLEDELKALGLSLNSDKTTIKKIKNFARTFDDYRSQSKYAVDRVAKNYLDSTKTQKNLAVTEFMNLLHSGNCNDDLGFIYSHLVGVPLLDNWRKEKVKPILEKGIGRGSLFKHLFNFILEVNIYWGELDGIVSFNSLQSEVFSHCVIVAMEAAETHRDELAFLITKQLPKLTYTDLVLENIAYLSLVHNLGLGGLEISSEIFIHVLRRLPEEVVVKVDKALLNKLNTALNNIESLSEFVEAMYPLCSSSKIEKNDLNDLSLTFYAKIANENHIKIFKVEDAPCISSPTGANKYYYLLCLFSISNKNTSHVLLSDAWKYCAHIFNSFDASIDQRSSAWFSKIVDIEYSIDKAEYIIS